MMGKVSIIIPAFNCGEFIAETLESVIGQTYENWECIVVDDGSKDNTPEIVKRYCLLDRRFIYCFQENLGPSIARNNGIAQTTGEFILPLDGDDIIEKTYIEKCVNHFQSYPQTKLVYCKAQLFGVEQGEWELPDYNYERFIWSNSIFCSAMFRRSDFNNTSGYNPNMRYGFEDWDFWLNLIHEHDIVYRIPEILFSYRKRNGSRDSITHKHLAEMQRQIVLNHPLIYEKYTKELIVLQHNINALSEERNFLETELNSVRSTTLYKLLILLRKPFLLAKQSVTRTS